MARPTTMRIHPDLLEKMDAEVERQSLPSRTWLMEQLVAKWLTAQGHDVPTRVTL